MTRQFGEGKTAIMVYAWVVPESSGGFEWMPIDGKSSMVSAFLGTTLREIDDDAERGIHSALVIIAVAEFEQGTDADNVTEFIDGELADAIAMGLVGSIIKRAKAEVI